MVVSPKLEKKIDIKIETKVLDFNEVVGVFESTAEKDPSLKKTNSWIKIQPKRKTIHLGSKAGSNPKKGHSDLSQAST